MTFDGSSNRQRHIWAYSYWFVPPLARYRTGPIEALLYDGHEKARRAAFIWEGRLINGDEITHILVVSDQPDQNLEVNHLLEAELNRLEAPFTVTRAVAIKGKSTPGPSPGTTWDA